MPAMMLQTPRLLIRDVLPADAAVFAQMAADGSLHDIGFDEGCGGWIDGWVTEAHALALQDAPGASYLAYTVVRQCDGAVLGSAGCSYYEDLHEVGVTFFLGAAHRGCGYALEAVRVYTEYFFARYALPRMIATVQQDNAASRRVVERAGFRLLEVRPYRDLNDSAALSYCFYELRREDAL